MEVKEVAEKEEKRELEEFEELIDEAIGKPLDPKDPKVRLAIKIAAKPMKRAFPFRIVRFFIENGNVPTNITNLAVGIGLKFENYSSISGALKRLVELKVLTKISSGSRNEVYYCLNERFPYMEILKYFYREMGYKFSHLLPYNTVVSVEEVVNSEEFRILCEKYCLTANEALQCLANCPKIECITDKLDKNRVVAFRRKETPYVLLQNLAKSPLRKRFGGESIG